jgi:hypothetical protein
MISVVSLPSSGTRQARWTPPSDNWVWEVSVQVVVSAKTRANTARTPSEATVPRTSVRGCRAPAPGFSQNCNAPVTTGMTTQVSPRTRCRRCPPSGVLWLAPPEGAPQSVPADASDAATQDGQASPEPGQRPPTGTAIPAMDVTAEPEADDSRTHQ